MRRKELLFFYAYSSLRFRQNKNIILGAAQNGVCAYDVAAVDDGVFNAGSRADGAVLHDYAVFNNGPRLNFGIAEKHAVFNPSLNTAAGRDKRIFHLAARHIFCGNGILALGHYRRIGVENGGAYIGVEQIETVRVIGINIADIGAVAVKLARTLWIIPLSFLILFLNRKNDAVKGKVKIPWFILYFIIAILIAGFIPQGAPIYKELSFLGRRGMVVALFLIGSGFSFDDLKKAGAKSFLLGILLWIIIAVGTFMFFMG